MHSISPKVWLALGVVTTVSAGCSKPPQPEPQSGVAAEAAPAAKPAAGAIDFSQALSKLLAGEGGEGGAGVAYENGKIVISPLKGEEIQLALDGNSFRRGEDIALDFKADGTFTGVEHPWVKKDMSVCEAAAGAKGYEVEGDECAQRIEVTFPEGKWSVKGDLLCTTPALPQAAESLECTQVFVAIDRISLFSPEGTMLSKGIELVKTE